MSKSEERTAILMLGMCSLPMGTMERQLGNMAILIPALGLLHAVAPNVTIRTSLQLSKQACALYGVTSLPVRSWYEPSVQSGIAAAADLVRALLWRCVRRLARCDAHWLLRGAKFEEIIRAKLVLDFSGDTFGDMAHPLHLVKHALDLGAVLALNKPVVFFAQSPGPFSGPFRRAIGRWILGRATVVCAREPVARQTVRALQRTAPVIGTACPAFLLAPADDATRDAILHKEGLLEKRRPRLGVTLTGFSFSRRLTSKDKYRLKRPVGELDPLIEILRYAVAELGMDVVLIPHVFRTAADGSLVHGPDSAVTEQLLGLFCQDHPAVAGRVQMLRGCYDAATTKALIGTCDLFLSGRLHAAVAALSQHVPTVLLAYGPKFSGFAALVGQQGLVSEAFRGRIDPQDVVAKLAGAWRDRAAVSSRLSASMPHVAELARLNAHIVRAVLEKADRCDRPEFAVVAEAWQADSERLLSLLGGIGV